MTTTFLHTGDEHIDNDTHGTINPETGISTAWESNHRVVRHLAETAVERNVDFYVSAGDNFKTGRPSAEALLMFVDAMSPLAHAGIPIVLLDGNHHKTGVSADHRTLIHVAADMLRSRGATVLTASEPALIRLPDGQQVAALPWLSKNRTLHRLSVTDVSPAEGDRLVAQFGMDSLKRLIDTADDTAPLIMASHVTVDDLRIDAVASAFKRGSEVELSHLFSEPILPRKELDTLPFSYGALSHIHAPQKVSDTYYYAGSPNRLTFTDMTDDKGANLVTIEDDGTTSVEKIITPARVMASIDLESPDSQSLLEHLGEGTLVQVVLEEGMATVPRNVRNTIAEAGATLADTTMRPKPRRKTSTRTLPQKIDPITALKDWAKSRVPAGVTLDQLVAAAENLEN